MIKDYWLSSILGLSCYKTIVQDFADYLKEIEKSNLPQPHLITIHSKKVLSSLKCLSRPGLKYIQQMNQYRWKESSVTHEINTESIRFHAKSDIPKILEISKSAFSKSRFHQDSRIGFEVAEKIKQEWILANLTTRKNAITFVSQNSTGEVNGFNSILIQDDRLIIDLIAVASEYRGQGVGRSLILKCQELSVSSGKPVFVGTQADNSAIRLYESLGFSSNDVSHVWHDFHSSSSL
jgi:ribosomal protein S18 acetylase RimI-like enzyme